VGGGALGIGSLAPVRAERPRWARCCSVVLEEDSLVSPSEDELEIESSSHDSATAGVAVSLVFDFEVGDDLVAQ